MPMHADNRKSWISHEAAKPQSVDDVIVALFFVPWCLCVSSLLLNRLRSRTPVQWCLSGLWRSIREVDTGEDQGGSNGERPGDLLMENQKAENDGGDRNEVDE